MVIKQAVMTINAGPMAVTIRKKASILEVEHDKNDLEIWGFSARKRPS